ncbi:hypothetical protein QJS04_geneDACA011020 [Acorus gramineus]|uniref:SWIM-type domain-containing protein n=1 Tax=Acorus gramineus TaxID=55184 RepID=A0AAV9BGQ3_ACOGR|nr:hypothetical protein QJS04_geneDACA011020 [Acorus gramineus]
MEVSTSNNETNSKQKTVYRCKRCRRIVAAEENVVVHEPGKGEQCFKWKKRDYSMDNDRKPDCSSIFVQPMKWMEAVQEGSVEEKLLCGGCKARLGSFNWAGMQCSCGAWLVKNAILPCVHGLALKTTVAERYPIPFEQGLILQVSVLTHSKVFLWTTR